jgi:ribonuclease HII
VKPVEIPAGRLSCRGEIGYAAGMADGPNLRFEEEARARRLWPVAGVDEAGRGPLAGPVVAAAVILDPAVIPEGIDDSKRLLPARREELAGVILESAHAVAVASACAASIDASDIRRATLSAMRRAVLALSLRPAVVLVDGRDIPEGLGLPARAIIGGDGLSLSVAAASIIAKVVRDRMMEGCDRQYATYGFASHKGYSTRIHLAALTENGPLAGLHRMSFAPLGPWASKRFS